MKTTFLLCPIFAIVLSCTAPANKPVIVDEKYEPEQEELYARCESLRGIGELVIGETTFNQAIRSNIYPKGYDLMMRNSFYNGYWGVAKNGGKYEKGTWIETNSKIIKQFPCPSLDLKMGQIEMRDFDLAFYDNKLVAIYFTTDDMSLHKHYIEKYGEGRGSYYSYKLDNEPCEDRDKLESTTTIKEERLWENKDVKLEYKRDYHFAMAPNVPTVYKEDSWYLLTSKSLYPLFLKELEKQQAAFDEHQSKSDENALNQF